MSVCTVRFIKTVAQYNFICVSLVSCQKNATVPNQLLLNLK